MHADLQLHQRAIAPYALSPVQAFGAVTAIILVLLAVFAPTTASMVDIWRRSETFTHGFLVVPAVLWFVWIRRETLARLPIEPSALALLPLAGAGLLWLLGELSSSLAPSQLAVVGMVPAVVAALFGWRWLQALLFPLGFLFFAVPFGEFLVPTLIDWTADFTVAALSASGVPVYREVNNFVIPSGRWSVVEACSGIRYLIASVMLGALYAWIMYRSPRKRALFIAAAIVLPLLANWVRAYGIVMLGHLSNNRLATGVDHLIYGWIFFGVLMAALFWGGARWRDDEAEPAHESTEPSALPSLAGRRWLTAHAALVAVAVLAWPVADAAIARHVDARTVQSVQIPAVNGWVRVEPGTPFDWTPDVKGSVHNDVLTFEKNGRRVSVVVAVFRNQRQGAELVTSSNQIVRHENERWHVVDRRTQEVRDDDGSYRVNVVLIRGRPGLLAVAQWYWLGATRTVSETTAKIDLALDRLLMRGDTSAWVNLATPAEESLGDAWPVLDGFVRDMGASVEHGLREMAAR